MTTYRIIDQNKFYPDTENILVSSSSSLAVSLRSAAKYIENDENWKKVPKIYIKVNGVHPFRTSAAYLKAYRYKVLVSSFARRLKVEYSPD